MKNEARRDFARLASLSNDRVAKNDSVINSIENRARADAKNTRRDFARATLKGLGIGAMTLLIPLNRSLFAASLHPDPEREKELRALGVAPEKLYVFMVNPASCIGCGRCVVADRGEYQVPPEQFRTWVERYLVDYDRKVYVDSPAGGENGYAGAAPAIAPEKIKEAFFVPKLCNMCDQPSCVQVCPVGATFRSPDGFVLIDYDHCVGCGYCLQACPYGVRFLNAETGTADKCAWCYHRVTKGKNPLCVDVCPTKARKFGDINDPSSEVARIWRSRARLRVLKEEIGNEPSLYYIDASEEIV